MRDGQWIAIMSEGEHHASNGEKRAFSRTQLEEVVDSYDGSVYEAPLVIGHPKNEAPAYGWISHMKLHKGVLYAWVERIVPECKELVRKGLYRYISAAFYTPEDKHNPAPGRWRLKHVGLLGAQAPAVKGLPALEFSEPISETVYIEHTDSTPPTKEGNHSFWQDSYDQLCHRFARIQVESFVEKHLVASGRIARGQKTQWVDYLLDRTPASLAVEFSEEGMEDQWKAIIEPQLREQQLVSRSSRFMMEDAHMPAQTLNHPKRLDSWIRSQLEEGSSYVDALNQVLSTKS